MNTFLGVALLCHPYILRLSSALTLRGFDVYAQILTSGNFTRFGKDSLFLIMAPLLSLFGKDLRELPRPEFFAMFYLVFITFINPNDFLLPVSFYHTIMTLAGAAIAINLYKKITNETKKTFFNCLIFSSWIFTAWIFLEKFNIKPYRLYIELIGNVTVRSTHAISHVSGPLGHPNLSGAYLALCIPALLNYNKLKTVAISLIAIYFCDSALPLVTAFGVISYFYWAKLSLNREVPFYLFSILGVIIFFTGIGGLDNQRFFIWENALKLDFNWLFGGGVGFFGNNYPTAAVKHEHNEFLAVFMSYGIIGLGILLMLFKRAVRASSPAVTSGLFGVFVNFYGNFPLHVSVLALVSICYYVICLQESEVIYVKKMERKSVS